MRIKNQVAFLILGLITIHLADISSARAATSRRVASEATEVPSTDSKRFGLGFATVQSVIPGSAAGTVTGFFELDKMNSVQAFLSLPSTSPFSFGVAGLYKHTISGNKASGFHIGGGIGIANIATLNSSTLGLGLNLLGGIHFELPGAPQILVNLDGGPSFTLISSSPSQSNFQLAAFSPALGASVVYLF